MNNDIPFRNASGAPDPTAHDALVAVQNLHDDTDIRTSQLIRTLKNIIELSGYDLLARIEVRHIATGRNYR